MHAVVEAFTILKAVPRLNDEKRGKWIERAGSMFGLTRSQAKKIVYGEVKDLRASRLDAMRARLNEIQEGAVKRREMLDGLDTRRAELRAGSGDPSGSGDRVEPGGGRGGGAGEGGIRADRPPAAAVRRAG